MPRAKRRTPEAGTLGGAAAPVAEEAELTGADGEGTPAVQGLFAKLDEIWREANAEPAAVPAVARGQVQVVPNLSVRIQDGTATLTLTCRFPYPGNAVLAGIINDACQGTEFLIASHLQAAE